MSRRGGDHLEKCLQKWLEARRYTIHRAEASRYTTYRGGRRVYRTRSHDLWGFVDLAGWHPAEGWLLAQVTTPAGVATRRRKCELHRKSLPMLGTFTNVWVVSDDRRKGSPTKRMRVWSMTRLGWIEEQEIEA